MKISRQEDYALILLSVLAKSRDKSYVPLAQVSRDLRLPGPFLKKIAQALKTSGLIAVKEGRNGGYRLAKKPVQITIEEIIQPFNPGPTLVHCVSGRNLCDKYASCKSRASWQFIGQKFHENMKKITLAEIIK